LTVLVLYFIGRLGLGVAADLFAFLNFVQCTSRAGTRA
jgi:hypothetical protein